MARIELTDDEVGMLNWFKEFPEGDGKNDETVQSLLAKGLLTVEDGKIVLSAAGRAWLDAHSRG